MSFLDIDDISIDIQLDPYTPGSFGGKNGGSSSEEGPVGTFGNPTFLYGGEGQGTGGNPNTENIKNIKQPFYVIDRYLNIDTKVEDPKKYLEYKQKVLAYMAARKKKKI